MKLALFVFPSMLDSESPVPDPETLLRGLSPGLFCFVVLFLFFPCSYVISFLIYVLICLSVCLMVAMLMSISTFFE